MSNNRNHTLDIFRFIAAFLVVIYHINEPIDYVDNTYRQVAKLGWLGVPIFFVLSGFCIIHSACHLNSIKGFFITRFFRIFPAYWVSLLIVLSVVFFQKMFFGVNSVTALPATFEDILANLTLFTNPVTSVKTINWVYWSLSYELFFYFIVGFSILFRGSSRLLFFIFISLLPLFIEVETGALFFLRHWAAFALGISVYYMQQNNQKEQKTLTVLLAVVNVVVLIKNFALNSLLDYTLVTSLMLLIILWSNNRESSRRTFFSELGDYSYSVYLIHVPIGIHVISIFKNNVIQQNMAYNIAFDLLCYAIVTILAYFMYKYIEKPAINLGKVVQRKSFFNSFYYKLNKLIHFRFDTKNY